VQVPHQEELANILSCSISSLTLKHLGLLLTAFFKSKAIWEMVIEKMEKNMASWMKIYFSQGGRLTIIECTLSSLSTYLLSLFQLLASIDRRLECMQRGFLWDRLGGEPKFHLVNWKTIYSSVPRGLKVKNIVLFNKALFGKWLKRFVQDESSLWR
jgi:hypothetical protein